MLLALTLLVNKAGTMLHPLNLAAAFVLVIILGSTWQLDEPSETSTMQAVAANKLAVQTDKLVLAGQP